MVAAQVASLGTGSSSSFLIRMEAMPQLAPRRPLGTGLAGLLKDNRRQTAVASRQIRKRRT